MFSKSVFACSLYQPYAFFTTILNRLLPISIVVFRYVYVCKSEWVWTARQRKVFHILIGSFMIILAGGLTLCSYLYEEKNLHYLDCIGQDFKFYQAMKENTNLVWLLPIYHPFHFISILAFFSYFLVVPAGYAAIYHFRRNQNQKIRGINEQTMMKRRNRNIVSTQFNFLIWIFETSGFLVLIPKGRIVYIVYFLLVSCASPFLYYVGIEVNRRALKKRIQNEAKGRKGRKPKFQLHFSTTA